MEDLTSIETDQLYALLVTYTQNYVMVEKEVASEKKVEYSNKINEFLAEIEKRKVKTLSNKNRILLFKIDIKENFRYIPAPTIIDNKDIRLYWDEEVLLAT